MGAKQRRCAGAIPSCSARIHLVTTARRGEQMSAQARTDLDAARAAQQATEAYIDRGAIGALLREDLRDVADKLLNDKYGAEAKFSQIRQVIGSDAQAVRGWKTAFSKALLSRVQSSPKLARRSKFSRPVCQGVQEQRGAASGGLHT
jgi:hypothetical protein